MAKKSSKRAGSDRKDGRLIRSLGGFARFLPFVFSRRSDAFYLYEDSCELTDSERWLKAQRSKGYETMSLLHLIIAAYVRVVASIPSINRFVAGRRIFARNRVEVSMIVKRSNEPEAPEAALKVGFEPSDSVYDVYRKLNIALKKISNEDEEDNPTTNFVTALADAPRFVTRIVMGFIRLLDYFGVLPRRLLGMSPLHSSMLLSDMSHFGYNPVHRNLSSLGTVPMYISYGARQRMQGTVEGGKTVSRSFVELRFSVDGRITDSASYAEAFKLLHHYIENPAELELPIDKVIDDIY